MAYLEGARFLYVDTPLGADKLLLQSFQGREGLSQLFEFQLELLAENATSVDFDKLIGQKVSFGVKRAESRLEPRHFHGIVVEISQGPRDEVFTEYRMRVAPEIWKLTRKFQSRIFQHITIPDLLKKLLDGYDVAYEIQGDFEQREYCTQYQETDFDLLSRLLEEEGIYYFFKFAQGSHKLVLANTPSSHPDLPSDSKLIYEVVEGGTREEERIQSWYKEQAWGSGKYTLWDHHFELPHRKLDATETVVDTVQAGKVTHKLKVAGNENLEVYENPGRYAQRFDGIDKSGGDKASDLQKISQDNKRTTGIRMQQTEAPMLSIQGMSNCRQATAGHKFTLQRHFNGDGQYVFTSVSHDGAEKDFRSGPAGSEQSYSNRFTCLPYALPFRPLRITKRPLIAGPQTAVVVGPSGEEIFTDKYSRVKVQFHWDREGNNDADSSCWLRVATPWAGKQWGAISIPRIGQEVVVAFIEGDPDRPIIVGSVYNADMMPPYDLPANKTQSGVKSRSSKSGGSDNYNEILFEDLKGSELIRIHAEKDELVEVENDRTEKVHHDESITVEHDRTENVKNDETIAIGGARKHYVVGEEQLQTDGDLHLTASQNQNEKVGMTYSRQVGMTINDKAGMNYAMDAGMTIHLKAGMSAVIEAGMGLTIKSSGGSIDINPAGVFIQGNMVFINSGAANLSGCGSNPTAPTSPGQHALDGLKVGGAGSAASSAASSSAASAAASSASSAAASQVAQQAQEQLNSAASSATSLVQNVGNQAFGAVSQVASQSLAAAEQAGQLAQGAAGPILGQINGAVKQAQTQVSQAADQGQQMLNTGMNAVRTNVQQAVQQTSTQVAQAENQAAQTANQAQQQLQSAANQAQQAANQAAQAGQKELQQSLYQGEQMLQQAQKTEQQAQQQLQQAGAQAEQMANQGAQAGQQALNQSAQQLSQTANQAAQTANQAAAQAQAAEKQLQQTANQAAAQGQQQIAQAAQQAQQAANQAAQQAQQTAQQAQQAANQAGTQAQQMSQQTQQQVQQASQAAQKQVTQAANQAQQQVAQATNQAVQSAQQSGQMTQQAANQVQQQTNQAATQAAQTVSNTAGAAYGQVNTTAAQTAQSMQKSMPRPGL